MYLLEIQRGCPRKCRFCFLGHAYLPPRFMPFEVVKKHIKNGSSTSKSIGFVGSAILSHPEIEDILSYAGGFFEKFSFSSMGLSELTKKPDLLKVMKKHHVKTITIAPETGKTLRRSINKDYRDEDIFMLLGMMEKEGMMTLKLYFMIGLPKETNEHVTEIKELIEEIHRRFKGSIRVTISIFVPKFHTPLGAMPFPKKKTIHEKLKILRGINLKRVHLNLPSYHHAQIEALSARGDEAFGMALYKKVFFREPLKKHVDTEKLLRDISYLEHAADTHPVKTGVNKSFLERERHKYFNQRLTPVCQPEFCRLCGVCKS